MEPFSTESDNKDGAKENCLVRLSNEIQHSIERIFEKIGFFVGDKPLVSLIIGLVLTLPMIGGFFTNWNYQSEMDKIWVPQDVPSVEAFYWSGDHWGAQYRAAILFVEDKDTVGKDKKNNILTVAGLKKLDAQYQILKNVKIDWHNETSGNNIVFTYDGTHNLPKEQAICYKQGGKCSTTSILSYFQTGIPQTDSEVLTVVNNLANGGLVDLTSILGGITKDSSGSITGAQVLRAVYKISAAPFTHSDIEDTSRTEYEDQILDDFGVSTKEFQESGVTCLVATSYINELGAAAKDDVKLFVGGFVLLIFYCCLAIGKRDFIRSNIAIAFAAILTVGLSILGSFGLSGYIGIIFSAFSNNLIFLILGLGVDDAFIIAGEFQIQTRAHPKDSVSKRMAATFKHAGVSIFITSITDIIVFGMGATTVLPALSAFCQMASLGVLYVFVLNILFFAPCVVWDDIRQQAKRFDILCCMKANALLKASDTNHTDQQLNNDEEVTKLDHIESENTESNSNIKDKDYYPYRWRGCCCIPNNCLQIVFRKLTAFLLKYTLLKLLILILTFGLFGACIYGTTTLEQEFLLQWFIPKDSYLMGYYDIEDKYFSDRIPISIYTRSTNPNYHFDSRDKMKQVNSFLNNTQYINPNPGTQINWFKQYEDYLTKNKIIINNAQQYHLQLSIWLQSNRLDRDIAIAGAMIKWVNNSNPAQGILTTRILAELNRDELHGAKNKVRVLDLMYDDLLEIDSRDNLIAFTQKFLFWEQFKVIARELIRNLGSSMACIFVIVIILVPNILVSLLIFFIVCICLFDVLGCMVLVFGETVNALTVCYLVISVGIAVDYSAHIGQAFLIGFKTKSKNKKLRGVEINNIIIDSLEHIGPGVFNGAFSTFLAVIVLSVSTTYVFQVCFKLFFLVVTLASLHAFIVLPVLFSTIFYCCYADKNKLIESDNQDQNENDNFYTGL